MVLGLTGGIASGKSLARQFLREFGANVIDADSLAHSVLEDSLIKNCIRNLFGKEVFTSEGAVDRNKLGSIVFQKHHKLQSLENIVHPQIRKMISEIIQNYRKNDTNSVMVIEVPLLFETSMENLFDEIILITSDSNIRIKRSLSSGLSEQDIIQRMSYQISPDKAKTSADYIIENNGSSEELKTKIYKLWQKLLKD
ncbi:MAG: dephospho-CoA kinase [Candidatus Theseobacter exili]|nr:dephospho-CoA kinase [Candidatus Theseobacter exili]